MQRDYNKVVAVTGNMMVLKQRVGRLRKKGTAGGFKKLKPDKIAQHGLSTLSTDCTEDQERHQDTETTQEVNVTEKDK